MKEFSITLLPLCALIFGGGCISHEEITYRDVARVPVEFENETAGRIFYEALSKRGQPRASESRTQVEVPIVFEHKTHEIAGPNYAFNDAVARCDTNKDGSYAIKHFHGKTLAEAEQLFADGLRECIPLTYTEDLMWMKPVGFRFYIQAAIRVALSERATGECDFINGLAGSISLRHEAHPGELHSCARLIADFCKQVFQQFDRYDANPEIYTGLREKYRHLAELFTRLANEVESA